MSLWQNFCQKRSPSVTKQLNNTAVHTYVGQLKLFLGRQGRLDLDRQGYEIFILMVGDTCVSATILHRFQW